MRGRSAAILERLEAPARSLVALCGRLAAARGEEAYLVGGCVRDLLLGWQPTDLDVVVEGDGMAVAQGLARESGGSLTRYHAFQTARVDGRGGTRVDVATARRETYPRPGQLPQVEPGSIEEDLYRRDFTINAMAVSLHPRRWDELLDPYGGEADLRRRIVRVLHPRSFTDDPTRILRALRFALRFGAELDPETDRWLQEAVDGACIDLVSGDRIRREVAYLFDEAPVEGPLRLQARGILVQLHPMLLADRRRLEALQEARVRHQGVGTDDARSAAGAARRRGTPRPGPREPGWALVLAACAWRLRPQHRWELARRLRLSRQERLPLIEAGARWDRARRAWSRLAAPSPAQVAEIFRGLAPEALLVGLAEARAAGEEGLAGAVGRYLEEYRWVEPELGGEDLLHLGVPAGPRIGELLDRLRAARLDGRVRSAAEEEALVRRWLADEGRG